MDGVNKTLYIPLYGKALVSRKGVILSDKTAERIWEQNPVPLGRKSKSKWLAYFMAMRAKVFDEWVTSKLAGHPEAVVLHIGCGLDSRVDRINGYDHIWYDVDFPEVISERQRYYFERGGYHMLSGNAAKPDWLTEIPSGGAAVVVLEGVSMYLRPEALQGLFASLSEHFSTVHLLMDVYTGFGARMTKVRNPVNEVGVTETYGIDDPAIPAAASEMRYVREHRMTPSELINELRGYERTVFRRIYAGGIARKIYRMYEYGKEKGR